MLDVELYRQIFEAKFRSHVFGVVEKKNTDVVFNLRMVQPHLNYIFAHESAKKKDGLKK